MWKCIQNGQMSRKINLLKPTQKEIYNLNSSISIELTWVCKWKPTYKKPPDPDSFTSQHFQTFKKETTPILHRCF